jgi:hypothetical protein
MPEEIIFDPTDKGTLRPNAKPLRKKGDAFFPTNLPDFGWEITLLEEVSADDPITLFMLVYLHSLVLGHVILCHVTALVQNR